MHRVFGRSDSADERDEADGGGGGNVGWINQQQEDVIEPEFGSAQTGEVGCRERLGGLLRYYCRDYRDAA